jgi:hypothetical protein
MLNAPTTSTRPTPTRRRARLAAAALATVVAGGIAANHVAEAAPARSVAMTAIPTPCDDFADCIYTAVWYVFYR